MSTGPLLCAAYLLMILVTAFSSGAVIAKLKDDPPNEYVRMVFIVLWPLLVLGMLVTLFEDYGHSWQLRRGQKRRRLGMEE